MYQINSKSEFLTGEDK